MTGQAAGLPDQEGLYPTDSINGQIQERLATFFAVRQRINRNREEDND